MLNQLPICILAGSDSRPSSTPEGVPRGELLAGPKGTLQLGTGRCMAAELVQRMRASNCFADPLLLGPRSWYEGKVDCEIIHVEGTLIHTLRQLAETLQERFDGFQSVGVTSCDILPSVADFRELLEKEYSPHADAMFWWQMVESRPEDLGASSWKPRYVISPDRNQMPLPLCPGHLVVVRPEALRLRLASRILQLAYRYRNRVLNKRYIGITLGAAGSLLAEDVRGLVKLELPVLSLMVPYLGFRGYYRYRRGTATLRDCEEFLKMAFLRQRYRRAAHGRPVVISTSSILSFAKDVDTTSELEELKRLTQADSR